MNLEALGWTPEWQELFTAHQAAGLLAGRVVLEHNHVCRVVTTEGERLAEVGGRLKHRAGARRELPTVGDWVALPPETVGARSLIRDVLPRRSWLSRRAAGRETVEQIVAANIDTALIVFGLDTPVKSRAIERYLMLARRSQVAPVVVLNKADLFAEGEDAEDLASAVGAATAVAGMAPVVAVSSRDANGLQALRPWLEYGRTMTLLGPSGAGKSSIVNRLIGREVLPTGEVRDWDARGRHTSVHRQLVVLDTGGVIIDTPGIRELQLWDTDGDVDDVFADIVALAPGCRFRDCRHDREPGCAVKAAAESGDLDAERYQHFLQLQRERTATDAQRDERARAEAQRQSKVTHKALKQLYKDRERR